MSKLIFCQNCTIYKKLDKSILWDCFITSSFEECIKYINCYLPKYITVSDEMLEFLPNLLKHIKKQYEEFPSIFIYSQSKIFDSLTDEIAKRQIIHADKIPLEVDNLINSILLQYDFSPKLKGYTYIKRALYEGLLNDGVYINIKKILYPNIATMYLVSDCSVERSIAFSVLKAYEKSENMRTVFDNEKRCPSNLRFLKHFFILLKQSLVAC